MEDICIPPERESNRPRGRSGTGPRSPLAKPPPEISVSSDEVTTPGIPFETGDTLSSDPYREIPKSMHSMYVASSQFDVFPYDPDPFPPFWVFEYPGLTPPPTPNEYESMDVEDPFRDLSAPDGDVGTDDVAIEDEEEEGEEEGEEEDWSLASSEQWQLVSDLRRDDHSTPTGFVLASAGTPSIPDDLMSFSTDQDEESSDEDEVSSVQDEMPSYHDDVSSFQDHVSSDHDGVSFYDGPGDVMSGFDVLGRGNSSSVSSKKLSFGQLSREDTLEDEAEGLEHQVSYDLNDNEECTRPLSDPLLSNVVLSIDQDRTGSEDIFHDTEDGDEDMETPRATSIDHINNVTNLHSWCSASHDDPDMALRAGGRVGLCLMNVPQENYPDTNASPESLQEESFFDSGNFQKVDDAYECYPAKFNSSKFDVFGPRPRKRDAARECRGWW